MEAEKNGAVIRRLSQVLATLLIQMLILFISAGTIHWLWAWILFGINILAIAVNSKVLPKELISERGNPKENVKNWDKVLTRISIFPFFLIYIICGLDQRFGWTYDMLPWVNLLGVAFMVIGHSIFTWAMVSNHFFSTMVRIQNDRKQTVAMAGPYKIVRHPGYMGFIFQTVSIPVIMGTIWGLVPAGLLCAVFFIRTVLEDSFLKKELEGYNEYANKVRYRLIPGIW